MTEDWTDAYHRLRFPEEYPETERHRRERIKEECADEEYEEGKLRQWAEEE